MIYAFHAVLLFGQLVLAVLYYIVSLKIRKCKYRPSQRDAKRKKGKTHPDGDLRVHSWYFIYFHLFFGAVNGF